LPKFVEAVVETVEMTLSAIGARNPGKRIELQVDRKVARSFVEQVEEL